MPCVIITGLYSAAIIFFQLTLFIQLIFVYSFSEQKEVIKPNHSIF